MDAVIKRIMEIEKQCAIDIERAEDACRKNIEAHKRALDQKKEKDHAEIISNENIRLTQALEKLHKQIEETTKTSGREYESCFNDQALVEAVKERIESHRKLR